MVPDADNLVRDHGVLNPKIIDWWTRLGRRIPDVGKAFFSLTCRLRFDFLGMNSTGFSLGCEGGLYLPPRLNQNLLLE